MLKTRKVIFMKLSVFKQSFVSILPVLASSLVAATLFSACYQVGDVVNSAAKDIGKKPTTVQMQSNSTITPTADLLAQYNWTLVDATVQGAVRQPYQDIIKSNQSKLNFTADQSISYTLGCNFHSGAFSLTNGVLSLDENMMSTRKACAGLDELETKFFKELNHSTLALQKDNASHTATLIQTHGAQVMRWQGMMKPEVRFGEPVTLFWEVDPTKTDCVDKSGKDQLCLRVRNINYDDRGIKVGSGAWRTFYGNIEGFEHNPELRQIIRLHAYNNPNGEPNPYYVYDMTVMSEIAK